MPEVSAPEQLPVAEARAGEPAAWDALCRRHQLPLYVFIFELVRDEQAALDLVQETFLAAVRHLGSLREDGKFGSWLFGIAHQKCLQRWRKRTEVLFEEIPESVDDFEDGPDDVLIRREQEAAMMSLLAQLPPPCANWFWNMIIKQKKHRAAENRGVHPKGRMALR